MISVWCLNCSSKQGLKLYVIKRFFHTFLCYTVIICDFLVCLYFLQSFQGHGLMRPSSVGPPSAPSPSASQGMQSINQPWLSGPPGKPPLPSPAYRQQINPQSLQQRTHISQQQQSMPTASQQQQPLPSNQTQEHFGQQVPSSRAPHVPHQPQVTRLQGPGNQKSSSLVAGQSGAVQPGSQSRLPNTLPNADIEESGKSVLSKRSIHELVHQVRYTTCALY